MLISRTTHLVQPSPGISNPPWLFVALPNRCLPSVELICTTARYTPRPFLSLTTPQIRESKAVPHLTAASVGLSTTRAAKTIGRDAAIGAWGGGDGSGDGVGVGAVAVVGSEAFSATGGTRVGLAGGSGAASGVGAAVVGGAGGDGAAVVGGAGGDGAVVAIGSDAAATGVTNTPVGRLLVRRAVAIRSPAASAIAETTA